MARHLITVTCHQTQDGRHVSKYHDDTTSTKAGQPRSHAIAGAAYRRNGWPHRPRSRAVTFAARPAIGALTRLLTTALVFATFAVLPAALAAGVAGWWGTFPVSFDSASTVQTASGHSPIPCSAPANAGGHPSAREPATSACSGNTGAAAPVQGVHLTAPSRPEGR